MIPLPGMGRSKDRTGGYIEIPVLNIPGVKSYPGWAEIAGMKNVSLSKITYITVMRLVKL